MLEVTQVAGRKLGLEPCPLLPPLTGLDHLEGQVEPQFSKEWCGIGIGVAHRDTLATSAVGMGSPPLDTGIESKWTLNLMPGEHQVAHRATSGCRRV